MSVPRVNYNAQIKFVNKESYNRFYKLKTPIKLLKYNCGNQHMTHYIQYDDNFFRISTVYSHPRKYNGLEEHARESVYKSGDRFDILNQVNEHINEVKSWKSVIDKIPEFAEKFVEPKKRRVEVLINKLKMFFSRK